MRRETIQEDGGNRQSGGRGMGERTGREREDVEMGKTTGRWRERRTKIRQREVNERNGERETPKKSFAKAKREKNNVKRKKRG